MLKKIKEKFVSWIDSEKGKQVMDAVVVTVGYGLGLLFIFTMIVTVTGVWFFPFSKSAIKSFLDLCKIFYF